MRQYSQRQVDVIDLEANQLVSYDFADVAQRNCDMLTLRRFATADASLADLAEKRSLDERSAWC